MITGQKCLDCVKLQKSQNKCICNNELKCAACTSCSWCINREQTGRCVPNLEYNKNNCPYSFVNIPDKKNIKLQEYNKTPVKITINTPNILNLSIYKIIFIVLFIFLLMFLVIAAKN